MLSSRPIQLNTDGAYLPAKTPSRGLKNRIENAHAGGGAALSVTGKGGKNANAFPKTPFQPSTVKPNAGKQRVLLTTTRPLGDKTPLPNRFGGNVLFQTPLPGMAKLSKLNQNRGGGESESGTPDSAQRPSSMRKHIKHPRNSGGKAFETPANRGNHWDVSDGDIVIPDVQPETIVEDEGDDMDEVEYGPPNTLDLPYEPPFDFQLPDYKEVGRTLFQLAHSCRYDDTPALPEPDFKEAELEPANWDMMPLPPIESDDPFYLARLESLALPSKVKAAIARPKPLQAGTKTAAVKPANMQPSSTKTASRTVAGRPASRAAPSTTAGSQKASTVPSVRSTTRSHSVASTRLASRTAAQPSAAAKPLPGAKATAALATSVLKRLPSARGGSSSNTTAHPGGKPVSNANAPRKAVEMRRPHTALAVGTAAKAKAKSGVVPYVDEVIVLQDVGFGMDDEMDFRFDV
ncbi:hypothetical protein BJ912DRAFT_900319 [Pholiota molesta]|nr:hypothetical protein BJ912DRAFT_900319 [Pholiota molesta]